jgi:DNA-binding MarR family transcriptional regulator
MPNASSSVPAKRTAKSAKSDAVVPAKSAKVVDLTHYAPAYFTWIANKLSSGASKAYLASFDVGIETWRLLVLLAVDESITAQRVCKVIGMDKASVSRVFKTMQQRGFIKIGLDPVDGRLRVATITAKGRALHDNILGIALERERAFLSVLERDEQETLISLLQRLHDNLPAVEKATAVYVEANFPPAKKRTTAKSDA